jgi:thiol-disulfide isomerase/thioredoxin
MHARHATFVTLVFGLLVAVSNFAQAAGGPTGPAPDFKLASAKGMVELNKLKGKVVYVDFWASWCTPCRKSFPWLNEMNKKYKDQGLEVIGINLDKSREPIDEFLAKTPAEFTIAYDPSGGAASGYKVMGMPSTYIIDRQGNIAYSHIGFREKDKEELEGKIKEFLSK